MNILVFTALWPNSEQPDFGIFVKHRIAALARQANVRVVAPVPYFPKSLARSFIPAHWQRAARVKEREVCDGLPVYHPRYLVTPKWGMRFYGRWMAEGAASLVRELHAAQPIDLIDAHYVYPDGWAAVRLGRAFDVPVVITARGSDISLFSQLPYIRPLLGEALESAAGVIAVSGALREQIIELGIEADKVAVIRNGIDRGLFHPLDRAAARKELRLEPEAKLILTVASLTPNKGVDQLIDTMAVVAQRHSQARLYVIGEGSERASLEARIARRNLTGRVFLIGARPQAELAEWYSAADLFCLASQREGCPNVVIEALACGTPVVAADVGGVSELITDPAYGCLIPSQQSAEGFAERIDEALREGWKRDAIAKHGGARSWDDVAVELMGYYAARGLIEPGA
jgi:glycosyltransferase involved in cell wall biosynthesis